MIYIIYYYIEDLRILIYTLTTDNVVGIEAHIMMMTTISSLLRTNIGSYRPLRSRGKKIIIR